MFSPQIQKRFVARIFTDRRGRTFRVVFLAAFVGGRWRGRIVSIKALRGRKPAARCFLPCPKKEATAPEARAAGAPIVSPFVKKLFFTSQPTRAPSRA